MNAQPDKEIVDGVLMDVLPRGGLEFELCGANNTLSILPQRAFEPAAAPSSNTSMAAPAGPPYCRASTTAASSTIGPRAVLIRTAPALIVENARHPSGRRLVGLRSQFTLM